ncbi:hypothetical protein TIFTF001_051183 [Ficus carica]|uniref:CCHC-type domain-containing protein n=1 Tax=Ficus carica TaxID=3494 RepID=A0AA88CLE4_FICCA|nr:hypothetical protein TIFTF001_051183 [Ficus carica]
MMKMFWTDIAKQVSAESSPPTLVDDCISRAIRAERKGNASNQGQQRIYPQKKNNQGTGGNNYPVCAKCGKKHFGVCRMGTNACYLYGKEGHYARNCISNNQNQQYPNRNSSNQLHTVQAQIEGPSIAQGRVEAPKPQTRIYAYTKGDVEAGTSHVVTGQIYITTFVAIALFDSGATHRLYRSSLPIN